MNNVNAKDITLCTFGETTPGSAPVGRILVPEGTTLDDFVKKNPEAATEIRHLVGLAEGHAKNGNADYVHACLKALVHHELQYGLRSVDDFRQYAMSLAITNSERLKQEGDNSTDYAAYHGIIKL